MKRSGAYVLSDFFESIDLYGRVQARFASQDWQVAMQHKKQGKQMVLVISNVKSVSANS